MTTTDQTPAGIAQVQLEPERAHWLPYAPAIEVTTPGSLLFLSGATALPLYHEHPHVPERTRLPDDIRAQTHAVMGNIKRVLDDRGLTWRHVVKITEYLTDIRDADEIHAVMGEYFGDWFPASTMVVVSALSAPGARLELDMTAAVSAEEVAR